MHKLAAKVDDLVDDVDMKVAEEMEMVAMAVAVVPVMAAAEILAAVVVVVRVLGILARAAVRKAAAATQWATMVDEMIEQVVDAVDPLFLFFLGAPQLIFSISCALTTSLASRSGEPFCLNLLHR